MQQMRLATALCHHNQLSSGLPITGSKTNSWKKFIKENPTRAKGI